jgi:hypothetical protein
MSISSSVADAAAGFKSGLSFLVLANASDDEIEGIKINDAIIKPLQAPIGVVLLDINDLIVAMFMPGLLCAKLWQLSKFSL